jgi:hypothetical protein
MLERHARGKRVSSKNPGFSRANTLNETSGSSVVMLWLTVVRGRGLTVSFALL